MPCCNTCMRASFWAAAVLPHMTHWAQTAGAASQASVRALRNMVPSIPSQGRKARERMASGTTMNIAQMQNTVIGKRITARLTFSYFMCMK
jgi:hypothetical protein